MQEIMQEIDYLEWILNSDLLQKGSDALTMVEPADSLHEEQRVEIKCDTRDVLDKKLYCFNSTEKKESLFPFFNNRDAAPKDLNRFCDYILLIQHVNGLFVFFLEMKRGTKEGAGDQINASCTFFDFILESAERIKVKNGYVEFDSSRIKERYRKIILKEERSNKRMTKKKDIENMDLTAINTHMCYNDFRPIAYCR